MTYGGLAGENVTRNPKGCSCCLMLLRFDQLVAASCELANLLPIQRCCVGSQSDPSMLADVGSAEEPDVSKKHILQECPDFETDAQLPLVLFQYRESLSG